MTSQEILSTIGSFSEAETALFEKHTSKQTLKKGTLLLKEGTISKDFYFILSGSFYQFKIKEIEEQIIDLHLANEWMYNQQSLTEQTASDTAIKAFSNAEILILSLVDFHALCAASSGFLQFGKIMNQSKTRTALFDQSMTPAEKYNFVTAIKPQLTQAFPLKMIASYLKVAPETLSRVRANHRTS